MHKGSLYSTSLPMFQLPLDNDTGFLGFPGGSDDKEPFCNTGDAGSIPGSRRSPEKGMATHSSVPGESHGQRSLAGYSPWGCRVGHNWSNLAVRQDYIYTWARPLKTEIIEVTSSRVAHYFVDGTRFLDFQRNSIWLSENKNWLLLLFVNVYNFIFPVSLRYNWYISVLVWGVTP